MNGFIIYDRVRVKKNQWFIYKMTAELKKLGIFAKIAFEDEFDFSQKADFALMRTENHLLSKQLEAAGVRVFNRSFVTEICNDKAKTYDYVKKSGIEIMPTIMGTSKSVPVINDFPKVIKPCAGHGGKNVLLVNSIAELVDAVKNIYPDNYVIQDVGDFGRDIRTYIIGGKIAASVERSSDSDFRSNFTLGGKAKHRSLTPDEKAIVNAVLEIFDFDFAGIDLIFKNGKPVFNEIEDIVGSRMVYSATDIDILRMFADYIARELSC